MSVTGHETQKFWMVPHSIVTLWRYSGLLFATHSGRIFVHFSTLRTRLRNSRYGDYNTHTNNKKNQIKNKKLLIDIHSRGPPLYMGTSVLLLCELHFTSISCITFTALLDSHISFDHWYGLFRRRHEDILRIRDDLWTSYSTGLIVHE